MKRFLLWASIVCGIAVGSVLLAALVGWCFERVEIVREQEARGIKP